MKTIIRGLSIPIVIFSVSLMTAQTSIAGDRTGVITTQGGGSVNIRAGDGTDTDLIGKAKTGETVRILEESGDWYKIDMGDDKTGYVRKDYVKEGANKANAQDESAAKEKDTADGGEGEGEMAEVSGTSVNVREGKGTNTKVLGKVNKGDKLKVLDKTGEWYKVEYDGKEGYVLRNYLKSNVDAKETKKTEASNSAETVGKEGTVVTKTTGLNIRAGMSKDAEVVGTAAKGEKVQVLEKTGEWYKIQTKGGVTGYATQGYIKLGGGTGKEGEAATTSKSEKTEKKDGATKSGTEKPVKEESMKVDGVVATKGSPANVRASNNLKAAVVTKINKGDSVQVVAKAGDWYKIELDGGKTGYVQRNLIKLSGSGDKAILSVPAEESVKVTPSKLETAATGGGEGVVNTQSAPLNVRAGKSTEAKVVAKVPKGSTVRILGKDGDWYKVQLKNGKTGYASSQFIQAGADDQEAGGDEPAAGGAGELAKGDSGVITTKGSPLNIRAGKSRSAKILTKAANGSSVKILEVSGEWYKVQLEDGTTGYANSEFVK